MTNLQIQVSASQSLTAAQRALVLMVSGYVVGGTTITALLRSSQPGFLGWLVLAAALGTYVVSLAFLRGRAQLRGAFASLVLLLLLIVVGPAGSEIPWIPVQNLAGSLCYASVLLLTRWWALPWIGLGLAIIIYAFIFRPSQVVLWAPTMPAGMFVVAQLALATGLLWWMWRRLWSQARDNDALAEQVREATRVAIQRQERARSWRRSAIVVHETVLNSIRYVMSADHVERRRLESYASGIIDSGGRSGGDSYANPGSSLSSVVDQVRLVIAPGVGIRLSGTAMSDDIQPQLAAALRDALTEITRNAQEHGGARNVLIHSNLENKVLRLVVTDDGAGVPAEWQPGIGLHHAVWGPIEELGGHVHADTVRGRLVTTIEVPDSRHQYRPVQPSVSFDAGRLTITAPLVGWVIGGIGVAVWFTAQMGWQFLPAIMVFSVVAFVTALVLFKPNKQARLMLLTAALAGAGIPALLAWQADASVCTPESLAPAFLNASGYAVLALVLWLESRLVVPLMIVGLWTAGGVWLLSRIPAGCREAFVVVELNTLIVVPLLLGAAYFAMRAAQRQEAQLGLLMDSEVAELARAEAQESFSSELASAAQRARDVIFEVARGAERNNRVRQELSDCDARIRTIIQVDPQTSGPVGLIARHLVEHALDSGTSVSVRAIDAHSNVREFPTALVRELEEAVSAASTLTIQVTDTGSGDLLSLSLTDVSAHFVTQIVNSAPEWMTLEIIDASSDDNTLAHVLITCPHENGVLF